MSYVNSVLQPGERIIVRGRLHWIVYWLAILSLVLGIVLVVWESAGGMGDGLISFTAIDVRRAVRCVVPVRLVHSLDHRDRGDRPARDLQATGSSPGTPSR